MTSLSHLRRRHVASAAILGLGLLPACSGSEHACTAMACLEGLNIAIDGGVAAGKTYEITVSVLTETPETVPLMTCTAMASTTNVPDIRCKSALSHSIMGSWIRIEAVDLKKVQVVVSSGGVELSSETFIPAYTSMEINGPGCGVCTSATIHVNWP